MKPWEETWTPTIWMHDHNQDPLWALETNHAPPKAGVIEVPFCEFEANMGDHAKLAAAAPEMARLLLELHDEHRLGSSHIPHSRTIAAVLRKAGVLEPGDT